MRSTDGDTEARSENLGPVYSDSMTRCSSALSVRQKQEGLKFEAKLSNTADPVTEEKQSAKVN